MSGVNDINPLRESLFETLQGIKSGKVSIETARAINETAQVIVNVAKVEVDFLRVNGAVETQFFHKPHLLPSNNHGQPALPHEQDSDQSQTGGNWQPSHVGGQISTSTVNGARVTKHVLK